jgi:hypothetical protein
MDQQHFTLSELFLFSIFLGSISFIMGFAYQLFVSIRTDQRLSLKQGLLVVFTRALTIPLAFFLWLFWISNLDLEVGPFFLPALIPELALSPLILKLFGYNLWTSKKACP